MRGTRRSKGAAAALLALLSSAAHAAPVDPLQQADAAVLAVGWKLARANAPFCDRTAPAIGLLLQDVRTFTDPAAARAAFGLSGDVAVAAVAPGSPADRAGVATNDTVEGIAGRPVEDWPATGSAWDRLDALHGAIDAALAQGGTVELRLSNKGAVTIAGEPACRVRFIVDDGRGGARASRDRVRVGRRLVEQTAGDEGLLAAIVAHEMAHAVLDHSSRLAARDRPAGETRRTEREADRLSVWLLAAAGYPAGDGARMMRTVMQRRDWLLGSLSHGSSADRADAMTREVAVMEQAGTRDWKRAFVPKP